MPIDLLDAMAGSGNKANRTGYWLRWWDESRQMLLWGTERLQQSSQGAHGSEIEGVGH